MRSLFLAFGLLVTPSIAVPSLATEPGTPMDCSDLELASGLTCTEYKRPGEGGFGAILTAAVDNDGRILQGAGNNVRDTIATIGSCGSVMLAEIGLVYLIGAGEGDRTPLVSNRMRCLDPTAESIERVSIGAMVFDEVHGSLLISATSSCSSRGSSCRPEYGSLAWIARIDGFASLPQLLPPQCRNGLDDDADGWTDGDDAHCKSEADNDESRP
jgi:hypothetical protein